MKKIDDMQAWRIFCAVAESGSISAACESLGIESSTASRTLKAMEEDTGAAFFLRDARRVTLTDVGRSAYERGRLLALRHREMIEALKGEKDQMTGLIRIAANPGLGPRDITPALIEYQMMYPSIRLSYQELHGPASRAFEQSLMPNVSVPDVAVGYGTEKMPPGIVRRYCDEMPFIVCTSSSYLDACGEPHHPHDLRQHTGLLFEPVTRAPTRQLVRDGCTENLCWGREHTFSNLSSAVSAMMLGAGILPDLALYHYAEMLDTMPASVELVPLLRGWQRPSIPCYVLCSEEAWAKRRVRDFVEWLAERERRHFALLRERFPEFFQY